LFFLIITF